jgi:arylsulfatase A-like enzyme
MKKRHVLAALLFVFIISAPAAAAATKPNIIVFYTDDHGHADLSCQGVVPDVKTPHVDALAAAGVRMVHGYSTAPQCVPSRGGLMAGKFQSRFGLESNGSSLGGFDKQTTIAQRLQAAGYVTAQFGKWHLGPAPAITQHGFKHVFAQNANRPFSANITLEGKDRPMGDLKNELYHIDGCSRAAAAIIDRYYDQPFFLYIAYRAPHVPLDAPRKYLARFPGPMAERRRQALAMLSAVDDGVGLVIATLKQHGLTEKTLIFYIGDNGAPLKIHKADTPLRLNGWDGSLNDPLNGEKGMLAEGGMHVPFLVAWPGTIPGGQTYPHPVSALDVAATAAALAKVPVNAGDLDGVNLIPHLRGEIKTPPHEALYWRWTAQSAIREGNWKLLRGGPREYLYDLSADLEEKHNLAAQHPDIASRLRAKLKAWCDELNPPGLALGPMVPTWNDYFDFYLEGKPVAQPGAESKATPSATRGWEARNGTLAVKDGILELTPEEGPKGNRAFLTRSRIKLAGPATARLTLKTSTAGSAAITWRTEGDKEFLPANRATFQVTAADDWQTHEVKLPASGRIIHLRVHLPSGITQIREIDFQPAAK